MTKKALIIGINYLNSPQNLRLNGCIDDVINMRNMLINTYKYDADNIVILRDDDANHLPTFSNILSNLSKLANESENLEEIWFHYSGHGTQINDAASLKGTGYDDVIVPCDFDKGGFISDEHLLHIIEKIKCRTICIFDCCHSGSICDLPWSFEYIEEDPWYKLRKIDDIIINNPEIYIFSGCRDDQTSADMYSAKLRESVGAFSATFIECIQEMENNRDILHIYFAVCKRMKEYGYPQKPVLSSTTATIVK
jgi:hypothetical protein